MHVRQGLRCLTVEFWFGINYIPQGTIELILRDDFVPLRYWHTDQNKTVCSLSLLARRQFQDTSCWVRSSAVSTAMHSSHLRRQKRMLPPVRSGITVGLCPFATADFVNFELPP